MTPATSGLIKGLDKPWPPATGRLRVPLQPHLPPAAASCAATAAPHPHRTSRHPAAAGRCRLVRRRRAGSARAATWGDNAHSAKGPAAPPGGLGPVLKSARPSLAASRVSSAPSVASAA